MTFSAILLVLLGFHTPSTTPLGHFQAAMVDPNADAARLAASNEIFTDQLNSERSPSRSFRKLAKQDAKTQTLTGLVKWEYKPLARDCAVPNCDHFALYDDATHANYEFDNARAALSYEGRRAKVTGVVYEGNSIIHVISIEGVK